MPSEAAEIGGRRHGTRSAVLAALRSGGAAARSGRGGQAREGLAHRGRAARLREHFGNGAVGAHLAFPQHHHARPLAHLVDQVRGPEHGEPLLAAQAAHMVEQEGAARRVEPDGRLVEQQEPRAGQEGARDLGAAPLPAGQVARPLRRAVAQAHALQLARRPRPRLRPRQPVQRRVVEQAFPHRQVGVERRLLEHHAERRQRPPRVAPEVGAEDADRRLARRVEQARRQREERALAGAVRPEQHRELARHDRGSPPRAAPAACRS